MRRFMLGIAAFVVAWLAVSLVLGTLDGFGLSPVAAVTIAIDGGYSTYVFLNGLTVLVLTIALARPVYRGFIARWGGSAAPQAQPDPVWPQS